MPDRILSAGSGAAALAALFLFAGHDVAQAARCPLGEIYRPSRGICVTKDQAVRAGIYRAVAHAPAAAASPEQAVAQAGAPQASARLSATKTDAAAVTKARPEALAAIERRAPVANLAREDALAFATSRKPRPSVAPTQAAPIQAAPIQTALQTSGQGSASSPAPRATTLVLRKPEPSPFGSLVALEPLP